MSEKHFNQILLDYLEKAPSPLTIGTISRDLGRTKTTTQIAIDEIMQSGKIKEIVPDGNSGEKYYVIRNINFTKCIGEEEKDESMKNDEPVINDIEQKLVNALDKYDNLTKQIDNSQEQLKSIYANIISLMSIFVSIFALITINSNIIFKITQENLDNVFWGIIRVNIFVVCCILALLIGVRYIILGCLSKSK